MRIIKKLATVCLIFCWFAACESPTDEKLTLLDAGAELEHRISQQFDLSATKILGRNGAELDELVLDSIKKGLVGFDHYVNAEQIIKKSVIRDRHYFDNLITAIVQLYDPSLRKGYEYAIDCGELAKEIERQFDIIPGDILQSVDITEENYYDIRQSRYQSILNSCTYEDVLILDSKQRRKFWLEYQHSSPETMITFYYPLFHRLFESNELSQEERALSIDRLLVDGKFEQIYGSQIVNGVLWPIADTTKLDSIRLSMGMQPMKEYLEYFGL